MYISSQNLFSSLRQSVLQTQSSLSTLQLESTSGRYADLGLQLGHQAGATIAVAQESSHLTALTNSNVAVSTRLASTYSAIDSITSDAQALSDTLITNASGTTISSSTQAQAQFNLQSLIGKLNTYVGGQYIFGGINSSSPPFGDYASTTASVSQALATDIPDPSQATPDDIALAAGSAGAFGALFEAGTAGALTTASTTQITSQIAPQQTIQGSVTANQAGFQQIAKAYSLLSALGDKTISEPASRAIIATATSLLGAGIAALTKIQSNIGSAQNAVSAAGDHITAQQTILTSNVSDAENVDVYSLSTKLTAFSNQLQVAYSLTSQLKSLSLVNYLSGG